MSLHFYNKINHTRVRQDSDNSPLVPHNIKPHDLSRVRYTEFSIEPFQSCNPNVYRCYITNEKIILLILFHLEQNVHKSDIVRYNGIMSIYSY